MNGAPAPGCNDCRERGHYCPGLVTADGGRTHLCFACDEGRPCGRTADNPKHTAYGRAKEPVERVIGGETVSMAPMASIGAEILGKPERRTKMGKRTIVTEKQLQRIAAADPKESCTSIGARIGLDAKVVDYQRRKLRKALVKPSPALHSLLTEPSVIELVQPENNEAATSNAEMRVESARTATVTLFRRSLWTPGGPPWS